MTEWEIIHEVPRLDHHICQVWWARVTDLQPRHGELLNEVEHARAQAYRDPGDRARFILGCALSRLVLSPQLMVAPQEVPLDRTCPKCDKPHGRPRLPSGMPQLSVSHSGDRVVVAVTAAAPVGVDVERVLDSFDFREIAAGVLTVSEYSQLMQLPPIEQLDGFFTYWTRKESVLKATGDGLSVPLSSITVTGLGERARLLSFRGQSCLVNRTTMIDLNPGPGYIAALSILNDAPYEIREFDGAGILHSTYLK